MPTAESPQKVKERVKERRKADQSQHGPATHSRVIERMISLSSATQHQLSEQNYINTERREQAKEAHRKQSVVRFLTCLLDKHFFCHFLQPPSCLCCGTLGYIAILVQALGVLGSNFTTLFVSTGQANEASDESRNTCSPDYFMYNDEPHCK